MIEKIQALQGSLFLVLATIVTIYALVSFFEEAISEKTRAQIGRRLLTGDFRKGTRKVLEIYLNLNSFIFGGKIFSIRSFIASACLTSAWAFGLITIYSITTPQFRDSISLIAQTPNLRWIAVIAFAVVLAIDYLSISVTRKIYRRAVAKGRKSFFSSILIDISCSILIFYIGISVFKLILSDQFFIGLAHSLGIWLKPTEIAMGLIVIEDFDMSSARVTGENTFELNNPLQTEVTYLFPEGVFFISSIMTSVWLWIYMLAYTAAWLMVRVQPLKVAALHHLNVDKKPLTVLTAISTVILALSILVSWISTFVLD